MEQTKNPENQIEETNNQQNQTDENKNEIGTNGSPIKRSLTGGLIGATVGYLATPENGKKLMEMIPTDKLKSTGPDIGQAVKEKSKKAVDSIGKLFHKKDDVSIEGYSQEQDETAGNETCIESGVKKGVKQLKKSSPKQGNEKVNERLDRFEEMLSKLIEQKEGQKSA
jgi:gas vesicle protein